MKMLASSAFPRNFLILQPLYRNSMNQRSTLQNYFVDNTYAGNIYTAETRHRATSHVENPPQSIASPTLHWLTF